jgi:tetratricopeptide (TPR) repeat protein
MTPSQQIAMLRRCQLIAALQQALLVNPDAEDIHQALRSVYMTLGYMDLALDHLNEEIRLTRAAGPRRIPGQVETREAFQQRLEELEKFRKKADSDLQRVRNDYELRAASETLGAKAQLAVQRGLAKRALEVLRAADSSQMTGQEYGILIHLLLTTGQIEELRQGFGPQFKSMLGPEYDRLSYLFAAAAGNYDEAGKYLDDLISGLEKQVLEFATRHLQTQMFQGAVSPNNLLSLLGGVAELTRSLAMYRTIRGMLAVEQGDTVTAAKYFRQALQTGGGQETPDGGTFGFEGRSIALHYAALLEAVGMK